MASNKILMQKQAVVDELTGKLKEAVSGVLVNYGGITVEDDTKLRAELRKAGVTYSVIKNSITGRACDNAGLAEMKDHLVGMTALAISADDPIAPAKILKEYADKVDSFTIKAGFIEGKVVDAAAVNELASTPSKEVLIGRILGSIQSPLYGLAFGLQAIIDKQEGGAEAAEA